MAQGLFKVGPVAGQSPHAPGIAWEDGPLRPEEMVSQPAGTRPDPCPSQTQPTVAGEKSTEMNILSVLLGTGRVHYSPQVGYHNNINPIVFGLVWFGWFYGISTFVGYLTPNPFLCK